MLSEFFTSTVAYRTVPHLIVFLCRLVPAGAGFAERSQELLYRNFLTKNLESAKRTVPNSVPFSIKEPFFFSLPRNVPLRKLENFLIGVFYGTLRFALILKISETLN